VFVPDEKTAERFFGFFTANDRNRNTRRAYYKAACRFSECEGKGRLELERVQAGACRRLYRNVRSAGAGGRGAFKPTVKQHLAALRMLFDWLVVGHVLDVNPAHAVRGPKYSQRKGKPVLDRDEARALIAAIDTGSLKACATGRLIGVMVYTFARRRRAADELGRLLQPSATIRCGQPASPITSRTTASLAEARTLVLPCRRNLQQADYPDILEGMPGWRTVPMVMGRASR
jgi:integrase